MLQQARQGAGTDFAMGLVAGGNDPRTLLASRRGATEGFRNRLIDIMREQEMARMMESRDEQQKKEAAYRATLPAEVQPVADVAGLPNIASRQAEMMMSPQQQPWRILTPEEEARVPGLDPALMYKTNGQDIEVLGGRPPVPAIGSISVGGGPPGLEDWAKQRQKDISAQMTEIEAKADGSRASIQRIDGMLEQAQKSKLTGALAPGIIGAADFLRSFGVELSPAAMADARSFQASINENHMKWVQSLGGARGMTDSENKKLADMFPKIQDSVEARVQILKMLRESDVKTYEAARRAVKRKESQLDDIAAGGKGTSDFEDIPNAPADMSQYPQAVNPKTGETLYFRDGKWQ
jgi:hypothetical protein